MGQERTSGLALIHTHYNMDINIEEVLSRFIAMNAKSLWEGLKLIILSSRQCSPKGVVS